MTPVELLIDYFHSHNLIGKTVTFRETIYAGREDPHILNQASVTIDVSDVRESEHRIDVYGTTPLEYIFIKSRISSVSKLNNGCKAIEHVDEDKTRVTEFGVDQP